MTSTLLPNEAGAFPRVVIDFHGISPPVLGTWDTVLEWHTAHTLEDVRLVLERIWDATQTGLEAVGWLSYEAAPLFDSAFTVHADPHPSELPLAIFALLDPQLKQFPHNQSYQQLKHSPLTQPTWNTSLEKTIFSQKLNHIQNAIRRGETYQVNLTHGLDTTFHGEPWLWYQTLAQEQQAGFSAFIHTEHGAGRACSPGLFFAWEPPQRHVLTKPMKGTIARAPDAITDLKHAEWLKTSEKNRAENVMIVDLLRNDLSKVASSVQVSSLFELERYATVWQMTSTIKGTIQNNTRWVEVLAALFPCGSIVGAPKLKTAEHIAQLESTPRGVYCGAIGWISHDRAIFNVPIRTIQWNAKTHRAWYGVGNGLTIDSDPEEEWQEMAAKCQFLSTQTPKNWALFETLHWSHEEGFRCLNEHLGRITNSAEYWKWIDLCYKNELGIFLEQSLKEKSEKEQWVSTRRVKLTLQPQESNLWNSMSILTMQKISPCSFEHLLVHIESISWEWTYIDTEPLFVVLAEYPISQKEDKRFLCHKTTHRLVYDNARTTRPDGIWEVILWNENGAITECSQGNIAVELNGSWYTPPISCGLLPGIARQKALERGKLKEKVISISELKTATQIAFLNSLRGWVPVYLKNR